MGWQATSPWSGIGITTAQLRSASTAAPGSICATATPTALQTSSLTLASQGTCRSRATGMVCRREILDRKQEKHMETLESIRTKRSIRRFTDQPVPEEIILQILHARRRPQ